MKCSQCGNEKLKKIAVLSVNTKILEDSDDSEFEDEEYEVCEEIDDNELKHKSSKEAAYEDNEPEKLNDEYEAIKIEKDSALIESGITYDPGHFKINGEAAFENFRQSSISVSHKSNLEAYICPKCGHIEFFSTSMREKVNKNTK